MLCVEAMSGDAPRAHDYAPFLIADQRKMLYLPQFLELVINHLQSPSPKPNRFNNHLVHAIPASAIITASC